MSLLMHNGTSEVTRAQLACVTTPEPTATWNPIPHHELLERVHEGILDAGLEVASETIGVSQATDSSPWGARFFGLLGIRGLHSDYALMLGVRNSHDQRFSAGLCVGSKVFVCDNLAFSSEIVIARKHTRFIRRDLPALLNRAFGRLGEHRALQDRRIDAYRTTELSDKDAHSLIIQGVRSGVVSPSKTLRVLEQWETPSHRDFEERSVWSLFNGFTEVLKGVNPHDLPRRTMTLHGLCDRIAQVA